MLSRPQHAVARTTAALEVRRFRISLARSIVPHPPAALRAGGIIWSARKRDRLPLGAFVARGRCGGSHLRGPPLLCANREPNRGGWRVTRRERRPGIRGWVER